MARCSYSPLLIVAPADDKAIDEVYLTVLETQKVTWESISIKALGPARRCVLDHFTHNL